MRHGSCSLKPAVTSAVAPKTPSRGLPVLNVRASMVPAQFQSRRPEYVGYLQAVLLVTASVLSAQWFLCKALDSDISEHAELE